MRIMVPSEQFKRIVEKVENSEVIEGVLSVDSDEWGSGDQFLHNASEELASLGYEEGDVLFISNYEGVIEDETTDAITNYVDIATAGIFLYEENHEQLLICANGTAPEHNVYFRVVIIKQ